MFFTAVTHRPAATYGLLGLPPPWLTHGVCSFRPRVRSDGASHIRRVSVDRDRVAGDAGGRSSQSTRRSPTVVPHGCSSGAGRGRCVAATRRTIPSRHCHHMPQPSPLILVNHCTSAILRRFRNGTGCRDRNVRRCRPGGGAQWHFAAPNMPGPRSSGRRSNSRRSGWRSSP